MKGELNMEENFANYIVISEDMFAKIEHGFRRMAERNHKLETLLFAGFTAVVLYFHYKKNERLEKRVLELENELEKTKKGN